MAAMFNVEFVAMVVGPKATGANAKFRGKTLKDCVVFSPAEDGAYDSEMLIKANPKFEYVATKLERGIVHKSYSTAKIAKWAKNVGLKPATAKTEPSIDEQVEAFRKSLEATTAPVAVAVKTDAEEKAEAKAIVAKTNAERKAAQDARKRKHDDAYKAKVAASKTEPSIEEVMAQAEADNAKFDAISEKRYKAISKELAKYGLRISVA